MTSNCVIHVQNFVDPNHPEVNTQAALDAGKSQTALPKWNKPCIISQLLGRFSVAF